MDHFHSAAGQTKSHWPQRTCTALINEFDSRRSDETFIEDALNLRHRLLPLKGAFAPLVDEADNQDA